MTRIVVTSRSFTLLFIASGKTTLVNYLMEADTKKSLIRINATPTDGYDDIEREIHSPSGWDLDLEDTLEELAEQDKILVIDDAHYLFRKDDEENDLKELCTGLFQPPKDTRKPKILLLSTAFVGDDRLPLVRKKFKWNADIDVDLAGLTKSLSEAGVGLNAGSVDFFLRHVCYGNFGMFMWAMEWVRLQQYSLYLRSDQSKIIRWTTDECTRELFDDNCENLFTYYLAKSRAVGGNKDYSSLCEALKLFQDVLFGGTKSKRDMDDDAVWELSWNCFLSPVRNLEEKGRGLFEICNFEAKDHLYSVSNPIMAKFYQNKLRDDENCQVECKKKNPTSGSDLIARVLPLMFADNLLVGSSRNYFVIGNTYKDAIRRQLDRLDYDVCFFEGDTSNTESCVVKFALATDGDTLLTSVADEFQKKCSGLSMTTFVVVGRESLVRLGMEALRHHTDIEIVGIGIPEVLDSHKMIVMPPLNDSQTERNEPDEFVFVCDRVPKCLEMDNGTGQLKISSLQNLSHPSRKLDRDADERESDDEDEDYIFEEESDIEIDDIFEPEGEDITGGLDLQIGLRLKPAPTRNLCSEWEQVAEKVNRPTVKFVRGNDILNLFSFEVAECTTGGELLQKAAKQAFVHKKTIFVYSEEEGETIRRGDKFIGYSFDGLCLASKQFNQTAIQNIVRGDVVTITVSLDDAEPMDESTSMEGFMV